MIQSTNTVASRFYSRIDFFFRIISGIDITLEISSLSI